MKIILALAFSIFMLTTVVAQEEYTMKNVYGRTGEIIAMMSKQGDITYVFDATGAPKGRCEGGQTFDETGVLISNSEIPGLLIDKD